MVKSLRAVLRKSRSLWTGAIAGLCVFAVVRLMFPAPPPTVCFVRQLENWSADRTLDREIDRVDFDDTKLGDVLRSLADSQHLDIAFIPKGLFQDQYRDSRITLHLRSIKLTRLLDLIVSCSEVGELDWKDDSGIITFGERDSVAALGPILTREYDVRALLAQMRRENDRFSPPLLNQSYGTFVDGPVPGTVYPQADALLADQLIQALTNHIAADTWQVNGGDSECIASFLNGKLIVGQRESVQLQVERLLSMLVDER